MDNLTLLIFSCISYVLSGGALCMELLTPQVPKLYYFEVLQPVSMLCVDPDFVGHDSMA